MYDNSREVYELNLQTLKALEAEAKETGTAEAKEAVLSFRERIGLSN